ncbi:hypothetical protein [Actinomadura graeca]|uniref:hypothetical protein n=1 Tax=Actinomadura graeca TaxID=2750812 RepID=UPI001E5974E5|nr:hypothetical protein [Actinomadura graeca]
MNATFRCLLTGALAPGALFAGVLGESAGARSALWAGAVILATGRLLIFFSPLRGARELPECAAG